MASRIIIRVVFLLISAGLLSALTLASQAKWRAATEKELAALIPARAPVEKEQIETEMRTASGVTSGRGQFIAGVVIVTAGYAAEGKYSHFLITQVPVRIGGMALSPGEYVFGYRRLDGDTLEVKFHEAATGRLLGTVSAHRAQARGPIRSLLINPPVGETGTIELGRFAFDYVISSR